jgi:hypothetical protein
VGKIVCRGGRVGTARADDFAHADRLNSAPLPTLHLRADEVIE